MAPGVPARALPGVPHPMLDLGEGLLDRVEVRRIRGRNHRRAPAVRMAWRTALPLWLARLSRMTMSPGFRVGTRCCSTQAWKERPLIGPSKTQGALSPSWRSPARKVRVRQRPCGANPFRRRPFGAQPRSGVMLVLIQVSSTNTSRRGSSRRRSACHRARLRATAARACSRANSVFCKAQALAPEKPPDRVPAHRDAVGRQLLLEPVDGQMRRLRHQRMHPLPVGLSSQGR